MVHHTQNTYKQHRQRDRETERQRDRETERERERERARESKRDNMNADKAHTQHTQIHTYKPIFADMHTAVLAPPPPGTLWQLADSHTSSSCADSREKKERM